MKTFRAVLFWCHLAAGATAGVVILIMSVTGVLLTYERQMMYWADTRGLDTAPPTPSATRLTTDALLTRLRETRPDLSVQSMILRSDPAAPVAVAAGRDGTLYVHPYTGAVLGSGAPGLRNFFRSVTNWHRYLALSGTQRASGKAVTGGANLLFLFIVCSGVYLWFPRTWRWVQFKQVLWFRRGLPSKGRDFNWHNVAGFWSAIPLAVVVASATVISYPWASNLVYRAMGEAPPAPARGGDRAPAREPGAPLGGLDPLVERAQRQVDGWRILTLRIPASPDAPVAFTIDRGDGGQPQKRDQLTLARGTGEVVRWEPFSANTPGRQARMLLRFAHTGEVLGLTGQTIAGLVSAAGALLVYTGLALSLRRFLAWRRRWSTTAAAAPSAGERPRRDPQPAAAARRAEALD